ncbi:MAG: S8 family serine peptidase [Gemmatimonadota bacterium]
MLALLAACAGENSTPTASDPSLSAGSVAGKRYIVVFKDNVVGIQAATDQMVATEGTKPDFVYSSALHGFAARMSDLSADNLRRDPRVNYITPDGVMRIDATQSPTPSWGLDRIDQRNFPLDNSYTYPNTAAGVHFYGIDTGILGGINGSVLPAPHADIAGRLSTGVDEITVGGKANDCNGHGTHTATTAAGTTYGVAKGATLHPVRVLDCGGSGSFAQVIAGIDWVTKDHQAHPGQQSVANMSLGGGLDPATNQAVRNSIAAGVVYSLSAGNSFGADACTQSPAAVTEGITVMAFDINDRIANFSNIGPCTDLGGPGVNITAGWIGSPTATNTISGTSMSAPHVAGAAMLYLSAHPGSTPAQVQAALVSNGTPGIIKGVGGGSFPANTPNVNLYMGFIGGGGGNNPPMAAFTYSCTTGLSCTFNGTGSSDDVGIVSYSWTLSGGNQVANTATFNRQFTGTKTFDLTLTVTDGGGLNNSVTHTVVVQGGGNQPPTASFTFSCSAANHSCNFDGSGSSDDVGVVSYSWQRTNGTVVGSGVTFNQVFPRAGTFKIVLVVTDGGGLTGSQTQTINVP